MNNLEWELKEKEADFKEGWAMLRDGAVFGLISVLILAALFLGRV